jgi:VWFA-related protein
MLKSRLSCVLCLFLFSCLLQKASSAQQPATSPASATNHEVVLDVVVTDSSGKVVSGLKQEDFTVKDNKALQQVHSFHAATATLNGTTLKSDPPVEIILVLDAYNATIKEIEREREGIRTFLGQNGAHLARPVSLAILTANGTTTVTGPSLNGNALINYFDKTVTEFRSVPGTSGIYGRLERFNTSIRAFDSMIDSTAAKRPGRKLLIWIGNGWPLISGLVAEHNLSQKEKDKAFEIIAATSVALRQARITVYNANSIEVGNVFETQFYDGYLKPVTSWKDAYFGNLGLQVIATQTGGQVLNASSDLVAEITTCIADADAFYVMSYQAPPADHPNEYHAITVGIARPGLTARSLTGYYNQP